jgi:hypothetical protein
MLSVSSIDQLNLVATTEKASMDADTYLLNIVKMKKSV